MDDKSVVDQCRDEIDEILKKHNCFIEVKMIATMKGNRFLLNVIEQPNDDVAKDEE